MEEITFTRDYRKLWKDARKVNSIELMEKVFNELAYEVGIRNAETEAAESESAKKAAESKNNRDNGVGGKKI
jgi:hypothetical protein